MDCNISLFVKIVSSENTRNEAAKNFAMGLLEKLKPAYESSHMYEYLWFASLESKTTYIYAKYLDCINTVGIDCSFYNK